MVNGMRRLFGLKASRGYVLGRRDARLAGRIIAHIVLGVGGLVMLMPFFWLVSSSLKQPWTIYVYPPQWIPSPAFWNNYVDVFRRVPVAMYARNTAFITLGATLGQVLSSSLAGYSFARLRFRGRDFLFGALLSTMMLPTAVTMIPVYVLFSKMKWVGTLYPLIVPSWLGGGAFSIFLLRQFFRTIPLELEEAALLDGAGRLRIFLQIMLPLSRPAVTVVTIFGLLGHWNDFMGPLIYLSDRKLWTLALGVASLKSFTLGQDWTHYMMVLSTLMVLPTVILFFAAQRVFVQGIVLTGMKG